MTPKIRATWGCPEHLLPGLDRYIGQRIATGDFLRAVLTNDLRRAVMLADELSLPGLACVVIYCEKELPPEAWGSNWAVTKWLNPENECAPAPHEATGG
jgi:hypothetical protein